jgi:transitional endoplasmic reticulum ATPase
MSVRLPVVDPAEALPEDRVGLPRSVLTDLGIDPDGGGTVDVRGGHRIAAPAVAVDADGVAVPEPLRRRANLGVGDTARVAASDVPTASTVTLRLRSPIAVTRSEDALRRRLDRRVVATGDGIEANHLGGALTLRFVVEGIAPSSPAVVADATEIEVVTGAVEVVSEPSVRGGDAVPRETYRRLRRAAAARFESPDAFASIDRPTLGVLLCGSHGSGKTTLVEAVASATDAAFVRVSAARLEAESSADREDRLDRTVEAAAEEGRAVVLLDDLDVLGGSGGSTSTLGARLRSVVDELRDAPGTVVVGATVDAESVPDALRRGGRFDREIHIPPLTDDDRRAALETVCGDAALGDDVDLEAVAGRLNGFLLADVGAFVDAAVERTVRRGGRAIRRADFDHAAETVDPGGLRDVSVEFPEVAWDEVGGLDAAKREVVRAVYWPLEHPERFEQAGIEPPSGVLLYGPPGTGKTLLARAVASLSDANFIPVNGPELFDRYVGESERAVRDLFATARENAPSIVFFDEIDAISPKRRGDDTGAGERVVSQLLTELDGLEPLTDVAVVAATNRRDAIDRALLRPGRIETAVETPLPDRAARREILGIHATGTPTTGGVDLDALADRTEGYSGGDLAALVREAAMVAIEDGIVGEDASGGVAVDAEHFERALAKTEPSADDRERPSDGP